MLDPRLLKENPGAIKEMLVRRNMQDFPLESLLELDRRRRELIVQTQELRKKKNILSEAVATKKKAKQEVSSELEEMKTVSSGLGKSEQQMADVELKFKQLQLTLPNLLHNSV
ncbi:MAG TPA: serine--tRNA ligase, partial [Nitrososphaera sp.]|nr:serine--tRNA ligase [Nitrososphaera sp.]